MAWEGPHASLGLPGQGWAPGKTQWEAGAVGVEGEIAFPQEQNVPVGGLRRLVDFQGVRARRGFLPRATPK